MEAYNSFNSEDCTYTCTSCGEEGHDSMTLTENITAELRCKKCNSLLFAYSPSAEAEKIKEINSVITSSNSFFLYRPPILGIVLSYVSIFSLRIN